MMRTFGRDGVEAAKYSVRDDYSLYVYQEVASNKGLYSNNGLRVVEYEEDENIPTFNVSSCYLTRLISISSASFQLHSLFEDGNEELIGKKTKQVLSMFDFHNRDEFTSFYDETIEMENGTNSLLEFIESVTISQNKSWTESTVFKNVRL